jgi:hypothetical protein
MHCFLMKMHVLVKCVKFEVLSAVQMKIEVFYDVTPYRLVHKYRCFGAASCFHLQWIINETHNIYNSDNAYIGLLNFDIVRSGRKLLTLQRNMLPPSLGPVLSNEVHRNVSY